MIHLAQYAERKMRRQKSGQSGSLAIKKDSDAQVWLRESIPTATCILLAPLMGMCSVRGTSRNPAAAQSIGPCFFFARVYLRNYWQYIQKIFQKIIKNFFKNFLKNESNQCTISL